MGTTTSDEDIAGRLIHSRPASFQPLASAEFCIGGPVGVATSHNLNDNLESYILLCELIVCIASRRWQHEMPANFAENDAQRAIWKFQGEPMVHAGCRHPICISRLAARWINLHGISAGGGITFAAQPAD